MAAWRHAVFCCCLAAVLTEQRSLKARSACTQAGPGSAFLPYAEGVAKHVKPLGLNVRPLETTGSIENLRKVNAETNRAGTVFMGSAFEAYTGSGAWTQGGQKLENLRALFP